MSGPAVGRKPAESADARVLRYWTDFVDSGRSPVRFVLRHPREHLGLLRAIRELPVVTVPRIPDTADGAELRRTVGLRGLRRHGVAVLCIPADPAAFSKGRSRQTLRRHTRAAAAAGLRARLVAEGERRGLLALANDAERNHPDATYKFEQPVNDDLLDLSLWLVVVDTDDVPILLAVVSVVETLSTLRYFRTLGWSVRHSQARYLGTTALAEELSRRGVRQLLDTTHPAALPNGLRHFQRMVGFRYARLALSDRGVRTRLRRQPPVTALAVTGRSTTTSSLR